jgi:hypothetical protein
VVIRLFHRSAAWLLVALVAIVGGVGEGLHLIPGLGHGIIVGNQVLVHGEGLADFGGAQSGSCSESRPPCCGEPDGLEGVVLLDEDDCPICQILSKTFAPGDGAPAVSLAVCAEQLTAEGIGVEAAPPAIYQARVPPRA